MNAHIPKDKLEKLLEGIAHDIKESVSRAYYQGYMQAKDDLVEEAKAIVKADRETAAINKIILQS